MANQKSNLPPTRGKRRIQQRKAHGTRRIGLFNRWNFLRGFLNLDNCDSQMPRVIGTLAFSIFSGSCPSAAPRSATKSAKLRNLSLDRTMKRHGSNLPVCVRAAAVNSDNNSVRSGIGRSSVFAARPARHQKFQYSLVYFGHVHSFWFEHMSERSAEKQPISSKSD